LYTIRVKLQNSFLLREYLRPRNLPTTWCPGCGLGAIMGAIAQAVHYRGLDKDRVSMVSGIGCTGRMSGYVDFHTLHTTHGRAPAFATGLKLARPEMSVIVVMGDGDAMSIGGNHLIHAMRRNIGLTAIVVNNAVYGLTGGQASPTTPIGGRTTTSGPGAFERPLNLETLARAAGASFYARTTVAHPAPMVKLIERALAAPGFALVEILSNCHVLYGRMNDLGDAPQMTHAFDAATRRSNPLLAKRAVLPIRLAGDGEAQAAAQVRDETVHADSRIARGVIFERGPARSYGERYRERFDDIEGGA
jgi:2-oxoglutarate ferredoxin oxidoreductase subunit beta